MKRFPYGIVFLILLPAFASESQKTYPEVQNKSFSTGEILDYHATFWGFSVGHGTTRIDTKIYSMNSRPCYKIDVLGSTSGLATWVSKVNDVWGAYVDTAALVTHVSYRKLQEGPFRRDEIVTFDHDLNKAEVKVMNKETGLYDNVKYYTVEDNIRDIVAGFLYLRVIDFGKYKKGDTLVISGFLEDTSYRLKIIYGGKEKISTKVGKIICHRLIPIVPDNKLFEGENSVTAWISADGNKIPVRIKAKMFIGSTGVELESFRGLRNQLKIVR